MRPSSGVESGLLSFPSGGGGVSPLGDRFQPDLVRGSGSYDVPIVCPPGPNDLRPSLHLTYSTGFGNGPFGLGWRLNLLRISRRTDRGVPRYTDDDTFVLDDSQVLVRIGDTQYRPRTDTSFWSIERLGDGWRIRTGDGRLLLLGQTPTSRESSSAGIAAWYVDEERDAAGNQVQYLYHRDGGTLYLDELRYSIFRVAVVYESRPDRLRFGRAGFEQRTALRASALELHCERLAPTLIRTYALSYEQAENGASLLTRVALSATDAVETAHAPPLTFTYSRPDFHAWDVHEIRSTIVPPSLADASTQLVDLTGDGLPDVLQSAGSRMLLWRNVGDGHLEGPSALDGVPSSVSLARGNVAFADLDGDGRVELFAVDQPLQLAFEADGTGGFRPDPTVFSSRPNLRLASPETRLMDVDGDGIADQIATGRDYFLLYRHESGVGWQEPEPVSRLADLEQFTDITFGDRGVRLADMTGDGLQDMVALQSGYVCFWPYLGNGA